jgi:hypothetical protein
MRSKIKLLAAPFFVAALVGVIGAPAAVATNEQPRASVATLEQPSEGRWVVDNPAAGNGQPQARADVGCAAGTTSYPQAPAYECLSVFQDGSGEKVVFRQGQSGDGAFGYLHGLLDHDVEEQTVDAVVSASAGGLLQANGRYLYGAVFIKDGEPEIRFETYQDRAGSTASPDSFETGIITSFCKGPGLQDPAERCPTWVNATLPAGVG